MAAAPSARPLIVGLISDTHGLMRPDALAALAGSDLILHAGDVGEEGVLDALRSLAPVHAVRGNVDDPPIATLLPETELVEVGGVQIYLLHDLGRLDLEPGAAGIAAVVSGHSHRPLIREERGVLYVNPGSAGPRRFDLPLGVGRLVVEAGRVRAELLSLPQ